MRFRFMPSLSHGCAVMRQVAMHSRDNAAGRARDRTEFMDRELRQGQRGRGQKRQAEKNGSCPMPHVMVPAQYSVLETRI